MGPEGALGPVLAVPRHRQLLLPLPFQQYLQPTLLRVRESLLESKFFPVSVVVVQR